MCAKPLATVVGLAAAIGFAAATAALLAACAAAQPQGASTPPAAGLAVAAVPAQDSAGPSADSNLASALEDLETAVLRRDTAGLVGLMDPDYKRHEHDMYWQGGSGDFLNNLFCGNVVGTDNLFCAYFAGITALRREKVEKPEGDAFVTYRVQSQEGDIRSRLRVVRRKQAVTGFVGSRGYTQVE